MKPSEIADDPENLHRTKTYTDTVVTTLRMFEVLSVDQLGDAEWDHLLKLQQELWGENASELKEQIAFVRDRALSDEQKDQRWMELRNELPYNVAVILACLSAAHDVAEKMRMEDSLPR